MRSIYLKQAPRIKTVVLPDPFVNGCVWRSYGKGFETMERMLLSLIVVICVFTAQAATADEPHGSAKIDSVSAELVAHESASYFDTFSGGGSIVDRVTELETSFSEAKEDIAKLQSDVKKKVDFGHAHEKMKIVGRVHTDYWGFPDSSPGINTLEYGDPTIPPQARLGFRRLRFGVRGEVSPNMDYRIEMEFAGGAKTEFKDAWIGFKHLPFLQTVLIGQQKRPYGLDHLNSSRFNVFMERPFATETFNEDARRFGVAAYGVSDDLAYNWRYGVYNMQNIKLTGNYVNNNLQPEFAGRFANTIWYDESSDGRGYAAWAVSGTYAQPDGNGVPNSSISRSQGFFRTKPEARSKSRWYDTGTIPGADSYGLLGGEAVVNVGPVQWVAEYQNVWMGRDGGSDLSFGGGYTYVSYFLTGEHMVWNRKTGTLGRLVPFENFFLVNRGRDGVDGVGRGWGAWQVAVRGSYLDLNDEDILGGYGKSVTFGLNWYWNAYARMQLNYIYGNLSDRDASNDP
ncbi:MAG: OprO/OprP family phosphate-selective porin, partial [Pirellulales bacterium]